MQIAGQKDNFLVIWVGLPELIDSTWQKEKRNAPALYTYPERICTTFLTYFGKAKLIEIQILKCNCFNLQKFFFCILPEHCGRENFD
jgi:hypothetical protein